MLNYKILRVSLCIFCALTFKAAAGDFDGSKPLSGVTGNIIEINQYKIIDNVAPNTVGLPKKFTIDFKGRRLHPTKDSHVRKSIAFERVEHIENKLVLQGIDEGIEGVEDGLAWSLTISKENGRAVLSAAGDGVAYVVFGLCKPLRE